MEVDDSIVVLHMLVQCVLQILQQTLVVELVQGWQPAAAESEDASPLAVIPCHLQDAVSGHIIEWVTCAQRGVQASHEHH